MGKIVTLAMKDLLLLWRDKSGLFWVMIFPLAFAVFFGTIFSSGNNGPSAIKIAVADEDNTTQSAEFVEELEKSDVLDVICLESTEARERVRCGKVTAYVLIEDGFGKYPGFFFGDSLPVRIGIDPSRKAEAGYLQGILTKLMFMASLNRMTDRQRMIHSMEEASVEIDTASGLSAQQRNALKNLFANLGDFYENADSGLLNMKQIGMGGIKTESIERTPSRNSPRSYYDLSFPQAVIWGLIGCAATFALSIVTERTKGTLLRLRLAPISRVHILAAKGLACFIACVSVVVVIFMFGRLVFGVNTDNIVQLSLATVVVAFCFVGIMMFISVLGKSERGVAGSSWAILLAMSMLGGGMVPAMFMPGWMKSIALFSPIKWAIFSFEGAIWRGFSLQEMLLPFGILFGIGLLFFSLGVIILSRTEI